MNPSTLKPFYPFTLLSAVLVTFCVFTATAQTTPSLTARYVEGQEITLDGKAEEAFWATAESTGDFVQFFPSDTGRVKLQTDVKVVYDDAFIYVHIWAASASSNYVVSTLKRDFSGIANDNVTLMFDTFMDGNMAFAFSATPYGVQREVLISNGGADRNSFNNSWDAKWFSEAVAYEDHYEIEMAIPFYSLKFIEGSQTWRFRPYRFDIQTSEQSTWVKVPQNQLLANLAFMGLLHFEKPLGKSRTPISLIPYAFASSARDASSVATDYGMSYGADAKVAIGNAMNLDVTVNPDFSNVEVDDILTNLTRFELMLPEKRQFFLDNSDLFGSFGNYFNEARPFFSRRIGLAADTNGNLIQNRILGGLRLSGKLNEDMRLGVLNIQTAADPLQGIGAYNNSMVSVQQKVWSRSNIGAFLVNRALTSQDTSLDAYNRVIGSDFNLATADNRFTGRFYVHKSFQPDDQEGNLSSQAIILYNGRDWSFISDFAQVDEDFKADLGFVPRTDFMKHGMALTRHIYPANGPISRHQFMGLMINFWRPSADFQFTDRFGWMSWEGYFKDQSSLVLRAVHNYTLLAYDFDPTRTSGATPLPGGVGYTYNNLTWTYTSNAAKLLTASLTGTVGQFYNGRQQSIGGGLNYRLQPWAQFSLNLNYDGIRLPAPYATADLWLVTPRMDITFNRKVFWTTIVQYSNQRDNLGLNTRLQWRYSPLSDFFLVYNDNYYASDFAPRFRSINLKWTYWLNV